MRGCTGSIMFGGFKKCARCGEMIRRGGVQRYKDGFYDLALLTHARKCFIATYGVKRPGEGR